MIAILIGVTGLTALAATIAIWRATAWRWRYEDERDARLALHQARQRDNDQRSADNERWAERVRQARLGRDL